MTEYDPADDARKSYDVAIEAKRQRGDTHWPERLEPPHPQKEQLRARCGDCSHVWVVAHLPMELTKVAGLMKSAACPACAGKNLFLAQEVKSND
ncbi:hypothetical protein R5W60_21730 (plasmid) [Brucella pseudintermedia]|uniref:hypothetical protein n=1 Tax=Brucella pseudintermedia TaxID=370111 RepID=UPI00366B54AF|nr:hypothetical protein R5W60_21730 [Brucella pseudintermedia]